MIDDSFEIHYCVRCRMSVTDDFMVVGYARTEEHLQEMLETMRKTWRYVTYDGYRSRKTTAEVPSRRKLKK